MRNPLLSLRVRSLTVRAMPGFRIGEGFGLTDLDHDVIVVLGPNGSGKSTLMRSVLAMLWPDRAEAKSAHLDGEFRLGETVLSAKLDAGRASWATESGPHDRPLVGSEDRASHYRLALPEMLEDRGTDLAAALRRELAGGLDLTVLDRDPRAKSEIKSSVRNEFRSAQANFKAASKRATELRDSDRNLVELEAARERLRTQLADQPKLQSVLDERSARQSLREARRTVKQLPKILRLVETGEARLFERLERQLSDAESAVATAKREIVKVHPRGESTPTDQPIAPFELQLLTDQIAAWTDAERAAQQAKEARDSALVALEKLKGDIRRETKADLTEDQLQRLLASSSKGIVDGFRSLYIDEARLIALQDLLRKPQLDASAEAPDGTLLENLSRAINLLLDWLAISEPVAEFEPSGLPNPSTLYGIGGLALLAGVALVLAKQPFGVGLIGLGIGLFMAGWFGSKATPRLKPWVDKRPGIQDQFRAIGLTPPDWADPALVRQMVSSLVGRQAQAKLDQERHQDRVQIRADLEKDADQLAREIANWKNTHREVEAAGGLPGETTPSGLAQVLALADAALVHLATIAAMEAKLQGAESEVATRRQAVVAAFQGYGYLEPSEARSATLIHANLATWSRHSERCVEAQTALEASRKELDERYERLGLAPDDRSGRDALLQQKPEFDRAVSSWNVAYQTCLRLRVNRFRPNPYLGRSDEELRTQLEALGETQSQHNALIEEIAALKEVIKTAKQGTEVEKCLEAQLEAEQRLIDDRDRYMRAKLYGALAQHVVEISRDQDMPPVLDRAIETFNNVTQGRYRLQVDQTTAQGEFQAFDRILGQHLPLNALSTGTKVQLLLAVRLAFVELQESIALPLLLDETLATTDPERSAEVIQAVGGLLSGGRQAFYFTTQPDEAEQWKQGLGERVRVVNLAEARKIGLRTELWQPVTSGPSLSKRFPEPGTLSRQEYGTALGVPPRLGDRTISSVHLWHLIESPTDLYAALMALGREQWGAFAAEAQRVLPPEVFVRTKARVDAIDTALSAYRIGRSEPITESKLRESKASSMAIDRILALDPTLLEDPSRLLVALSSPIPGVRKPNPDHIIEFLRENQLVDENPSLGFVEVLDNVLHATLDHRQAGLLTNEAVEAIVRSLPFPADTLL